MPPTAPGRTDRHYLMCEPVHYTVSYEINPWMDKTKHTDADLAVQQWRTLRDTYLDLGHTVETIDPIDGLPDMVYAANGATVVDGVVYSARFRYAERAAEGPAYQKWFADRGYVTHTAAETNEGEGDLLVVGDLILAGTGLPHRPRRARRGPGAVRPPGRLARAGRPALLPPRHRAGGAVERRRRTRRSRTTRRRSRPARAPSCEQLFPDAMHATERDARRPRPERGVRRAERRRRPRRRRPRRSARRARLQPDPRRHQRAAQGRRRRQVLHARDPPRDDRVSPAMTLAGRRPRRPPSSRTTTTRCPSRSSTGSARG